MHNVNKRAIQATAEHHLCEDSGDQFVDGNSQDGYKWLVKAKLDYGYQADINIFVIGGVE